MSEINVESLKKSARHVRQMIINMIYKAQSGHPGGSLSIVEILVYIYEFLLNKELVKVRSDDRDRVVLSKGHAAPALYAVLAECGIISKDRLSNFRQENDCLEGHPSSKTPGIDASTGSLGHGASVSAGMALAAKIDKKNYNVYCILGDGELQEGQVWEAFMFASHYALDNIFYIIDENGLQLDGKTEDIMDVFLLKDKLIAFGFNVVETDAHDFRQLHNSISVLKNLENGRPNAIIASSIKGKGISFMENNVNWHGKAPTDDEYKQCLVELNGQL